jgi:hypothetical protein
MPAGTTEILRGVDLAVQRGEIVAVRAAAQESRHSIAQYRA